VLAALTGVMVFAASRREERLLTKHSARPEHSPLIYFVAAYASLLPIGFAFSGFPSFSRMYYLPGLGVGIATALIVTRYAPHIPRTAAFIVGGVVMWTAVTFRDYAEDLRQGARMLRSVAEATLRIPANDWGEGVLIVAPDVVGTFSSAAVQSWTVRPAAKWWWRRVPAGPLFFGGDCVSKLPDDPVRNEFNVFVAARTWGRVVAALGDSAAIGRTTESACAAITSADANQIGLVAS
jgi:hypothetical protein